MAVTKKGGLKVLYNDIYPNSTDTAKKTATPPAEVTVDCYYIEYVDEVTGDKRELPVYLDENGHPFVSLDLDGSGTPKYYPLLGGGSAPIPPMTELGADGKKKEIGPSVNGEVLYVDIYNDEGMQEKIYLPAQRKYFAADGKEKTANDEFVDGFKRVFSFDEDFLKSASVTAHSGAEPDPITRATANKHFLSTHLPAGDLVYNKMNTAGDAVEMSYLYITHDNAGHRDFVRMMVKPGEDKLYINLDNVDETSATKFAAGTTFEVRKFLVGPNAAGVEVLKAEVYDGKSIRTVELPITKKAAEKSTLFDEASGRFYTPSEIATRDKAKFTEIDATRLPQCKNKKVAATQVHALPSGNLHYEVKDVTSGALLQTHYYISYIDAAGKEQHFQFIQKDGHLYGNFNTNPSDATQFETCLIDSIAADGTVTYIAGDPGEKFSGKLPFDVSANPKTIQDIDALAHSTPLTRPSTLVTAEQVLDPAHAQVTGTRVVEMVDDGALKTNGSRRVGEVSAIEEKDDFMGMTGVKGYSQTILLPDGSRQTLSTFHHEKTLVTISEHGTNTPIATFSVAGTSGLFPTPPDPDAPNSEMSMSEEKAKELGLYPGFGKPDGGGSVVIPIDAIQLSQNGEVKDVVIKAGSSDVKLSFSSQGIVASTSTSTIRLPAEHPPLDIGISDTYYNNAINMDGGKISPLAGCTIARDGRGNIANKELNGAILESLVRQQRKVVNSGKHPIDDAMTLSDGSLIISVPAYTPASDKPTWLDYYVAADGTVYQYQHRTKEASKGTRGADYKPGWQKVEQVVFRRDAAGNTFLATTLGNDARATSNVHVTNVGTANPTLGVPLRSLESNEALLYMFSTGLRSKLGIDPQLRVPTTNVTRTDVTISDGKSYNIPIDGDNSDFGAILSGDDGVAQLVRDLSTAPTYPAVSQLEDAQPSRTPIDPIVDPEAKAAVGTKDSPRPKPPKERQEEQLWTGIKDENRKTWFALLAIATLFSVFIPFLNIVAGVLLGIIAANETEFLKNIFYVRENYHTGLTTNGKGYDRKLVKNQAKIRDLNANIEKWTAEMKALDSSGKTPKQIATEKAKLQAKIDAAKKDKADLIKEDHDLAVLIAQDQDLGLRAELESNKKWRKILGKENARFSTIDPMEYVDSGGTSLSIKNFKFATSTDAELQQYKTQLEALRKNKSNSHVKDILDQQIEFCELVELTRKASAGKLTRTERMRHKKLLKKYPAGTYNSPVDAFVSESGKYQGEIEGYLERSDAYIEERKARAEASVTTDEIIEGGDKDNNIESGIDLGLATYDVRGEARREGGNIENQDDKSPRVDGVKKRNTARYK